MKKCRYCKKPFQPFNSMQKTCCMSCALADVRAEAARQADKSHRERKREFRANDIKLQRRLAQQAFNAFVRGRDSRLGCVSCDKGPHWQGQWAAGHWKTVGSRPDLRFNEDNVHKQCNKDCNQSKSGNVGPYREELLRRIGLERVAALEVEGEAKRYRAEDYREIAKYYRDKLKELKRERAA